MKKYSLIRTIYLYLFTMIGLVLMTIGSVNFVNMGLKAFVFTKAEEQERINYEKPPVSPYSISDIEDIKEGEELSAEEKVLIGEWLEDYEAWQEKDQKVSYITSRRHQDASRNLALMLIGLPLYLYHWGLIKRETREENNKTN
jgi:hypothetical protein